MNIPRVYWYVLLIVMLETMAMSCFKRSTDSTAWFAVGVLFYAAVGYLLRTTFNSTGMAMTNALWSGLSLKSKIPTRVVATTERPDQRAFVIAIPVELNVVRRRYPTAA